MDLAQEKLRRIFHFTQAEGNRFFRHVRIHAVREWLQMPCPLGEQSLLHLGWVDLQEPLVIVRAVDLPRLCVLGAQAIAGTDNLFC
ncbi:MAG TPA: hypothetical protein PK777_07665 [Thermoguttaceae bacterium]|nr:hypothetical protein [Thermoguttaceae bacterium]